MLVDYHMHLERDTHKGKCRFTLQRVEEYVEAARRAGVDEIAVTEHVHWFRPFRPMMEPLLLGEGSHSAYREWAEACFHEELDEYVEVLVRAKQKGLPVKVGLEVDWIEGYEEDIARILEPYPWDILLGSVHFLGPWCIDFAPQVGWPERRVDDVYAQYLQQLEKLAASGLVDVLAHPDLPKKFGHRPAADMTPAWQRVAEAAARMGLSVEVSTAGLAKPVGEMYPSLELLRLFHEYDVPVTLASDAHAPEEVGRDLNKAVALAREAGCRSFAVYEGRTRRLEPLPA